MINPAKSKSKRRRRLSGQLSQLLLPGLQIKRWLLLLFGGVTVAGLGFAFAIRESYINNQLPNFIYTVALRFLPDWMRAVLLLSVGAGIIILCIWQINRAVITALSPSQQVPTGRQMVSTVLKRQARRQGPKIVAIGGGTGMPQLLRGLRDYTDNITAVVTVADDGGSSGRLRRQMGMLPPGDFRNNIAALSEAEELMTRLFQYRFATNPQQPATNNQPPATNHQPPITNNELAGHSFGNLFITTMAAVTGSFEMGLAESSRVLAVRGRVMPSTLEQVTLCADIRHTDPDGSTRWEMVEGESKEPDAPRAYPGVIQAILQADLIVASPGSFFTSVMPNLLVPEISAAIRSAKAFSIYLCNVATQAGETDDFTVSDHMRHLRQHAGDAFTTVLANHNYDPATRAGPLSQWVTLPEPDEVLEYTLYTGDLIDPEEPRYHDANKLAARLIEIYNEDR